MKQLRSIFLVAVLLCCSLPGFSEEAEKKEGGVNGVLYGYARTDQGI